MGIINRFASETFVSDNITANIIESEKQTREFVASSLNEFIDTIYPVGSIYMSANNVSPASLFGGTWEQIKDTFLLAAGNTYSNGNTGGESQHTLTINEMPSHKHAVMSGSTVQSGVTDGIYIIRDILYPKDKVESTYRYLTYLNYEGGSAPHNNMPPYLVVYMWKRIE